MSKPVIYYTLIKSWSAPGYKVMEVTSEKYEQIYGRTETGPTHVRKYDCRGKFDTALEAISVIKELIEIDIKWKPIIEEKFKAYTKVQFECRNESDFIIRKYR